MNTILWVAQAFLALSFGFSGLMKAIQPYEKVTASMSWAKHVQPNHVRLIGVVEVLAAIGLIVPALTGILPWLTPLAAVGLILTMLGAMRLHLRINEAKVIPINLVLLLIAAFIAYGRFIAVPLS